MAYERPQPTSKLGKPERQVLLRNYYEEYKRWFAQDPSTLNRKVPREVFADLLDRVGELLQHEASMLVNMPGPLRDFLNENPLPASLEGRLPDEVRAFALALNALKQWVAAEQAAIDRYLLGGRGRDECRAMAEECIVSQAPFTNGPVQLHHPVRDGRPPIPLSKEGHAQIEGQD